MLETFCTATNIKAMVQDPTGLAILNEAATILGQYCDPFTGGNIHAEMDILLAGGHDGGSHQDIHVLKTSVPDNLLKAWKETQAHLCQSRPDSEGASITLYKRLSISGRQYCSHTWSNHDSGMFFQHKPQEFVPGVIVHIFSTEEANQGRKYYFAIRRNLPLARGHQDPFKLYSDFGASLWCSAYRQDLDIFPLGTGCICHSISMEWAEAEVVLKPLNQVKH